MVESSIPDSAVLDSTGPARPIATPVIPTVGPLARTRAVLRRRWVRRSLIAAVVGALIVVLGVVAVMAWMYSQAAVDTTGTLAFATPLAVPPLLEPTTDDEGRQVFHLDLQQGTSELRPGTETTTWGADGPHLGPTLRARRGDRVVVHVDNGLPEATTLHWHGMHLPAAADGGPHQVVAPGARWSPSWEIDQPAATLWYHPHLHGRTAAHVHRGLAGVLLVDDDQVPPELPSDYAVDDIPLILQDVRLADDGALTTDGGWLRSVGPLGDRMLVNGTFDPHLEVTTEAVRLRLVNASISRVYDIGFDDDRTFELVATDGGLLAEPHPTTRVPLSPGERAEIVVRVASGERTVLRSSPPDLGLGFGSDRFAGGHDRFDLLEIRAADELAPSPPLPGVLAAPELADPAEAVTTRRFELQGSSRINGRAMDMARIDEVVAADTTEIWEVVNASGMPHNFHVHEVQFRVLDIDGALPPPHLAGRKDTVFLPPGRTVRLALRFGDHTDPDIPYMYHCHLLAHEDAGMMGQFTVVAPDEVDDAPRRVQPADVGRSGDHG